MMPETWTGTYAESTGDAEFVLDSDTISRGISGDDDREASLSIKVGMVKEGTTEGRLEPCYTRQK